MQLSGVIIDAYNAGFRPDNVTLAPNWDLSNSILFSITVITTIGQCLRWTLYNYTEGNNKHRMIPFINLEIMSSHNGMPHLPKSVTDQRAACSLEIIRISF